MAIPNEKNQLIEDLLTCLTPSDISRPESIRRNICSWCKGPATEFKNEESAREYRISGFCQKCQDVTYKEEND